MRKKNLLISTLVALTVVPMMLMQALTPETVMAEAPSKRLPELPGFTSEHLEPTEAELTVLPKDTTFDKRLYVSNNGLSYQVSMIIGGKSKSSIHRPELCLPTQGFEMSEPHTISVDGISWRTLKIRSRRDGELGFAYTFYNQEGFRTSSHAVRILRDIWDRSVRNRIDRWVMIQVNLPRSDEPAIVDFLRKLKGLFE